MSTPDSASNEVIGPSTRFGWVNGLMVEIPIPPPIKPRLGQTLAEAIKEELDRLSGEQAGTQG